MSIRNELNAEATLPLQGNCKEGRWAFGLILHTYCIPLPYDDEDIIPVCVI
jgi:hypothetical protein